MLRAIHNIASLTCMTPRRNTQHGTFGKLGTRQERLSWGPRVREERKRQGQTQAELAAQACVSANTVSNLEGGKFAPQEDVLRRILDALGLLTPRGDSWTSEQWAVAEMVVALYASIPDSRKAEASQALAGALASFIGAPGAFQRYSGASESV